MNRRTNSDFTASPFFVVVAVDVSLNGESDRDRASCFPVQDLIR